MSRLSKLGYNLSSSAASSSFSSSSFSSSFSRFKDRRTPTVPYKSFVSDSSPIRSAGVSSFTEVRRDSYLSTRASRASATAAGPAPSRPAPSLSAPSTRFVRAPVPARTGTGDTLTRSLPSKSREAAQQDGPLDVVHSIMERARLRSQALRSRYGHPERPRVDPRTQPRVEPSSTSSVPATRPTRFTERIRILAEEAAASSANRRATLSKLAAFDEVVARVRARKQSTPSAPPIDATRPVTRSERVRPSVSSVSATRPVTRPVTSSERVHPSASSVFDRISDLRAAQAERRRWIDEMIAQQKERALTRATTSAAIEQFRAKHQARLANRSREGHLTSPHPAPTNSIRTTAIPAADPVRTRRSTPSAHRLRKDKPAKRVRFGDVTLLAATGPLPLLWLNPWESDEDGCSVPSHSCLLALVFDREDQPGIDGATALTLRTFCVVMTHPARSAKGGAPPRRANAETDTEDCVRLKEACGGAKVGWWPLLKDCIAAEFRFDFSARGPRPIESLQDGGGGWWLVLVGHMRVDGPVVRRKLNIGGIPTHTGADELEVCAG
ncbi:hypothetical protein CNMCM8927_008214 [Aspergillus lentulus]|uniref:Uncharacterized protein n=1 Tax=Aspergillus lentulus TaxID=293939 RepID=A0AAN6BTT8_ASPLE|nr:hypothetical protein CNMCM8927_008214 [Aspergillus lentulus]